MKASLLLLFLPAKGGHFTSPKILIDYHEWRGKLTFHLHAVFLDCILIELIRIEGE